VMLSTASSCCSAGPAALLLVALAYTHTPIWAPAAGSTSPPGCTGPGADVGGIHRAGHQHGFDRRYGVLRLLATTPWPGRADRGRVVRCSAALLQTVVLGGLGLALGWRPQPWGLVIGALGVLAGTAAFVALGLLLAAPCARRRCSRRPTWSGAAAGRRGWCSHPALGRSPGARPCPPERSATSCAVLPSGRADWGALAVLSSGAWPRPALPRAGSAGTDPPGLIRWDADPRRR